MFENFSLEIIGPALTIGLMLSLAFAPLGLEVLRRGIIFIDLAIAHIAGLGLIMGAVFLHHAPFWVPLLITGFFVTAFSVLFWYLEKLQPQIIEALIGASFVLAASITIFVIADHPHAGELLTDLLSGQILFVSWDDVIFHVPLFGVILLVLLLRRPSENPLIFYLVFGVVVTAAVQLVGVYIVFAGLILPALTAQRFKRKLSTAWIAGIISISGGVVLGVVADKPIGPCIVICYGLVYLLVVTFQRLRKGDPQTPLN